MPRFDTIVLGLGAMGSATAYHLAKLGLRVLGLDRFSPPHVHGSTHGDTRITRLAIGEGAHYTPLAIRSHALWRELERETGKSLLTANGGLIISSAARSSYTHVEDFFENTVAAAKSYGIAHEILDAAQIRRRFPQFRVNDDEHGYFEKDAGFVRPEACIAAHLEQASARGAELHTDERVTAFDVSDAAVTVTTVDDTYSAERLVVAAGPWLPDLVGDDVAKCFTIYRQVMLWFDVAGPIEPFIPENFPIFIWELQGRRQGVYGFPAIDGPHGGMKVATEQFATSTTADAVREPVSREEIETIYDALVAPFISGLDRRCVRAASCLYTVTRDFGFVIDQHPGSNRVLLVSPCSGHGFKHAPAIGELCARWAVGDAPGADLAPFALARFHDARA